MWWWIRHSMCIGDMRFRLENTGKIQIEYIDVFPHIFEVEASQCGGHSKRPLTETMFERESSFSLQICRKVVSTGSCFQVFGHPPDLPQAVWRHSKFVSAAKQKNIFADRDLEWLFGTRRGLKKVDVVHVKRVVSKFSAKGLPPQNLEWLIAKLNEF